jgi:hypothetical protein
MKRKLAVMLTLAFVSGFVFSAQSSLFTNTIFAGNDGELNPITSPEGATPTPIFAPPVSSPETPPSNNQNNGNQNNSNNDNNNNNSNNSSNSNNGSQNNGPWRCGDSKPTNKPVLFQVNTNKTTATLYYTPLSDATGYSVIYGNSMKDEHGYSWTTSNNKGVQKIVVGHLSPNKTYYFKISAHRGCASSDWSAWMKAKTTAGKNAVFYMSRAR